MPIDPSSTSQAARARGASAILGRRGALRRLAVAVAAASTLAAAACVSPDRVAAPRAGTPSASLLSPLGDVLGTVLSCPVPTEMRTAADTEVIGPDGGELRVGRNAVVIPAGAVASPETFTLTVPADDRVRIEVRAAGYEHYRFTTPVRVTVDYARCGDLGLDDAPLVGGVVGGLLGGSPTSLHGWYVQDGTDAALEDMGGVTDATARTHTFRTPHFSTYLLAE